MKKLSELVTYRVRHHRNASMFRLSIFGVFCLLLIAVSGCNISFNPEPIPQPFPPQGALATSGFEHEYDPGLWNDGGLVQNSTNCYAYILNRWFGFPLFHKLQPGELSGNPLSSASDIDVNTNNRIDTPGCSVRGLLF